MAGHRGHQQLRPAGGLGGQLGHQVQGLLVAEQLDMVKDQATGWVMAAIAAASRGTMSTIEAPGPGSPRTIRGSIGSTRSRRRLQVGQQQRRIIVALVDSDPGHRARLAFGPLGQQGRLAIAGRGDHADHRHPSRGEQPIHQQGPGHGPRAGPAAGAADSTNSNDDPSQDRGWRFGLAARPT